MSMIDKKQLKAFIKHAKSIKKLERDNIVDVLLTERELDGEIRYGYMTVDNSSELSDNHCVQCQQESPLLFCFGVGKDFGFPPNFDTCGVGTTKYQAMLNGSIPMNGLNIIGSLLNWKV